jgi:hypothetical protein
MNHQPPPPVSPPGSPSAFTGSDSDDGLGTTSEREYGSSNGGGAGGSGNLGLAEQDRVLNAGGEGTHGGDSAKKSRRTGFIETLYTMANTPDNESAIGFASDGISLEIRNTSDFSSRVLPKHFKHKNVSSFIRQLNNYGFRTIPSPKGIFQTFVHDHFLKDRRDLIKFITRRSTGEVKKKKTLYEQVVEFKQREHLRVQRMEELETKDMQRSLYVNELEHQNQAFAEERDALIAENQRLMMILTANGIQTQAPPVQSGLAGQVNIQQQMHQQTQHAPKLNVANIMTSASANGELAISGKGIRSHPSHPKPNRAVGGGKGLAVAQHQYNLQQHQQHQQHQQQYLQQHQMLQSQSHHIPGPPPPPSSVTTPTSVAWPPLFEPITSAQAFTTADALDWLSRIG